MRCRWPRADLSGPLALVVGAEGAGLSRLVRETCDWLLAIPMYGQVASLNAAVAGSIALVAARQARGCVDRCVSLAALSTDSALGGMPHVCLTRELWPIFDFKPGATILCHSQSRPDSVWCSGVRWYSIGELVPT